MSSSGSHPLARANRCVFSAMVLIGALALVAQADEPLEQFMATAESVAEELGFAVEMSRATEGLLALKLGSAEQPTFVGYRFYPAGKDVGYVDRLVIVGGESFVSRPGADEHKRFWKELRREAQRKGIRLKKLSKKDLGDAYYGDPVLDDYLDQLQSPE